VEDGFVNEVVIVYLDSEGIGCYYFELVVVEWVWEG